MNNYEIINETNEEIKEIEDIKKLIDFALKYQKVKYKFCIIYHRLC